jgi:hypothetical protein
LFRIHAEEDQAVASTFQGEGFDNSGWIACHNCTGRHILRYHAAGTNHGILTDRDSTEQGGPGTN